MASFDSLLINADDFSDMFECTCTLLFKEYNQLFQTIRFCLFPFRAMEYKQKGTWQWSPLPVNCFCHFKTSNVRIKLQTEMILNKFDISIRLRLLFLCL